VFDVIIFKSAEDDLKQSCEWYELQQTGLSKRFLKDFFGKLTIIQNTPLIYSIKFSGRYRFARLNDFPFFIVFEIKGNTVLVNSVFHTSRNSQGL
jgi:plasmid stabilization system protein ParE